MLKRIKQRLFILRHSLMSRWMLITCLIVVPVNVFAILTVHTMGTSYLERMTEQLRGEMNRFAQQVEYSHETIQSGILSDILSQQMRSLSSGDPSDSIMTVIRLRNSLSSLALNTTGYIAAYVYDRQKDLYHVFNRAADLPSEVREASEQLARETQAVYAGTVNILSAGNRQCLSVDYAFPYFTFGYLLDLQPLMRECSENCIGFSGTVAWAKEDAVVAAYPDKIAEAQRLIDAYPRGGIVLHVNVQNLHGRLYYLVAPAEVYSLYPPVFYILLAAAFLSVLVIPLLYSLAKRLIMNPLTALADGMQQVEVENLDYRIQAGFGTLQMDYLIKSFNQMTQKIQHMTIASYEQQISKLQTETINAHLQVNQHMLINSLNVAYSLIQMKRYDEASEFTVLLMKYFQYALRKNSAIVTVRDEIAFVEDYIRLQKIRLKNRFTSVHQVTEEVKDDEIPQLLIQGFVENAIKYAIVLDRVTEILIDVREKEGRLCISVADDGEGMEKERLDALREGRVVEDTTGKHVGLWNVRKRLDYYYGEDYKLVISSSPGEGTLIHVSLPRHPAEREKMAISVRQMEESEDKRRD